MDENLLEITEYNGIGFKPLVIFENWRVAILNHEEAHESGKIAFLEKHMETDEVFVLLSGKCTMLIGDGSEDTGKIHTIPMEQGKLYNVRKGVWHSVQSEPDTKLLIVEDASTDENNSKYINIESGGKKL
jgi:mannose-6-phosphate isomerase-like protein (cupin superfamily)